MSKTEGTAEAREYGPRDFGNFSQSTRRVEIEEKIETASVRLSADDAARMIETAIRTQYRITHDYSVMVTFLDLNRSDEACVVEVTRKLP
ncbi:MAG: hypothetical protein DI533_20060 [Cereibacter sphaeroides]|uniref:Uncharacterized protein n=1 Tax=Cereibacter sphaeroides TaxID=1063 RepID=A0A2W5THK2_CERSP|nr:MAG: hypothetical protein DI533_20060 [Cereibacter sphaeroides]